MKYSYIKTESDLLKEGKEIERKDHEREIIKYH